MIFFINHQKKLLSLEPNPNYVAYSVDGYVLLIKGGDYFTLSKNGNRTRLLKIKNKLIIGCFYK